MVVHFVDIGRIVDHHCLNFFSKLMTDLYIKESPMRLLMQILKILPNKHAIFILDRIVTI